MILESGLLFLGHPVYTWCNSNFTGSSPWFWQVLGNYLKRNYVPVIKHTKRSMLHYSALYKFTIDIDIENLTLVSM